MKKDDRTIGQSRWPLQMVVLVMTLMLVGGCMKAEDQPRRNLNLDDDVEVRVQQLSSFCSVQIEGHGAVDVENDYLPSVIACENGNAPMEALKAQAVAARTYALFITEAEQRALAPTTDDQVYDCDYTSVEQRHIDAVEATAGQVLVNADQLIAAFYVAGAEPSASSCKATSGDADSTNTEQYVTYNEGKIGGQVTPTSLGSSVNPANRGAKSQNGATCLADAGWDYERILRYYYGDDARAKVAEGSSCAGPAPDGGDRPPAGGSGDDVCNLSAATGSGDGSGCVDPSQKPTILPRSAWNARTPAQNRAPHTPNRLTVHHTVTANNHTDSAAEVKNVQNIHMNQGWSDVGYHYLIGWDGKIYSGNPENRIGAHAGGENTGNLGIALLGTFHQNVDPSDAQIASLTKMLRHLGDKHGIALNRSNVKGHGEWSSQSTVCPGKNVRDQLDSIVDKANSDIACHGEDLDGGGTGSDGPDVDGYRYVRVTGVSNDPVFDNDVVDGFEVDAIYFERNGDTIPSANVLCSPGTSNPGAALGTPDNTSCENRAQTVAGVPDGAELIVELDEPVQQEDILHVTQHAYNPAMANCEPTGTAKVSVSADGKIWKVLDDGASGNWRRTLDEGDFVFDENDETFDPNTGFEFIAPKAGQWYKPDLTFKVKASHPDIVEVEYYVPADAEDVIDEDWIIGTSTNSGNNYRVDYEFEYFGDRRVAARGLDGGGNVIADKEIVIHVTDFDGVIPPDQTDNDSFPQGDINTGLAAQIAEEGGKCYDPSSGGARCTNGTGGFSTGHCWRFVKRALERAGIAWSQLQNSGPCSAYRFQLSAYGFRCNADPNPGDLAAIGLQKIDVPTTQAPEGSIIAWDKGCAGYHSEHGHIEISQGDGTACSDYCGDIRTDATCASVYVPVN